MLPMTLGVVTLYSGSKPLSTTISSTTNSQTSVH
jgi:hypothetical protein